MTIRVFEAFAGYGGASFGLKRANISHRVVGYSEINPYACQLYEMNHSATNNYGDITKIDQKLLPDFDLFTGGFPCQSFSTAGKGLGELDARGTLFYDIIRICEAKSPTFILLENVKGLLSKKHLPTFAKIISELKRLGYNIYQAVYDSADFGIPQHRERVWIFASKINIPLDWQLAKMNGILEKWFSDLLDEFVDERYYKSQKQALRLMELTGVDLDVAEPCCFDIYNKKIRTDGICITLTEPHHNTLRVVEPMVDGKYRVRRMTETEHFRFMGFKDGEIKLGNMSYAQLCRCASNGWDVNLVANMMQQIKYLASIRRKY